MNIVYRVHWLIPWSILILGMFIIVRFARAYMDGRAFTSMDSRLLSAFSRLIGFQAALGLLYFLWSGFAGVGFPGYRILHGVVMFAAAVTTHLSRLWKNADDQTRFLNNFFMLLASFMLMLIGVSVMPNVVIR